MTPGRDGYQRTNMPNTNERIPEFYESLVHSNVRGICFRGDPRLVICKTAVSCPE